MSELQTALAELAAEEVTGAADRAEVHAMFDVRQYRPVHRRDLEAIWRALESMQKQISALTAPEAGGQRMDSL